MRWNSQRKLSACFKRAQTAPLKACQRLHRIRGLTSMHTPRILTQKSDPLTTNTFRICPIFSQTLPKCPRRCPKRPIYQSPTVFLDVGVFKCAVSLFPLEPFFLRAYELTKWALLYFFTTSILWTVWIVVQIKVNLAGIKRATNTQQQCDCPQNVPKQSWRSSINFVRRAHQRTFATEQSKADWHVFRVAVWLNVGAAYFM